LTIVEQGSIDKQTSYSCCDMMVSSFTDSSEDGMQSALYSARRISDLYELGERHLSSQDAAQTVISEVYNIRRIHDADLIFGVERRGRPEANHPTPPAFVIGSNRL
jgi:hypothetical protein